MNDDIRKYLYYLLNFGFVINNPTLYTGIRDLIYSKRDIDTDNIHKLCMKYKPHSDDSELMSYLEYTREKKLKIILGN